MRSSRRRRRRSVWRRRWCGTPSRQVGCTNHLGTDQHDVACDASKALSRAKYLLCYAEKLQGKLSAM